MNKEQITIGELLETPPGDQQNPAWVNGDVTGIVGNLQQRQTKTNATFFTGTLTDPDTNAQINFSCFGRKVFPQNGELIVIGGQGISLGEYNGANQLTIGQKATIVRPQGGAQAPAAAPTTRVGVVSRAGPTRPAGAAPAANGRPSGAILGVTVGMAVNNACQWATEFAPQPEWIGTAECHHWIYEQASHILRTAALLEKGKTAKNKDEWMAAINQKAPATGDGFDEPATQEPDQVPMNYNQPAAEETGWEQSRPAAQAPKPRPGPEGSVALNPGDDDDVPF